MKNNFSIFFFLVIHRLDNIGAEIIENVRNKSRYSHDTDHLPRIGLHEFMRQSGAVCFSVGQFPQGIPKSK